LKITREQAKERAQSRDCSCVQGKDRDNNYNEVIDEVFDFIDDLYLMIDMLRELRREEQIKFMEYKLREYEKKKCF